MTIVTWVTTYCVRHFACYSRITCGVASFLHIEQMRTLRLSEARYNKDADSGCEASELHAPPQSQGTGAKLTSAVWAVHANHIFRPQRPLHSLPPPYLSLSNYKPISCSNQQEAKYPVSF